MPVTDASLPVVATLILLGLSTSLASDRQPRLTPEIVDCERYATLAVKNVMCSAIDTY